LSDPSAIIRISLAPNDQLKLERWDGRTLTLPPEQVGQAMLDLLRDPSLPNVESAGAGNYEFAQQMIELLVPKEYQPAATAGVPGLINLAQTFANSRARSRQTAAPGPQQQAEPGPNPRSARRRGQRIA